DLNLCKHQAFVRTIRSTEIDLEEFIRRLLVTAIEHAGAERGLLMLPRDGRFWIEAEALVQTGSIDIRLRGEVATRPNFQARSSSTSLGRARLCSSTTRRPGIASGATTTSFVSGSSPSYACRWSNRRSWS